MELLHIIRFIGAAMMGAGFLLGILAIAFFITSTLCSIF